MSEEELDNVLASIDLELSIQRANIALNNTEDYLRRQNTGSNKQQLRLAYEPKLLNKPPMAVRNVSIYVNKCIKCRVEKKDLEMFNFMHRILCALLFFSQFCS